MSLLIELLPVMLAVLAVVSGYDAYRKATTFTNERNAPEVRRTAKRQAAERGPLAVSAVLGLAGAGLLAFAPLVVPAYLVGRQVKRRYDASGDLL